jgi:transketolase
MKQITQRDAFWNKIYQLALKNKDIVVVTADMGAPSLDRFRIDLPGQFINVGIAEQNAILVASGLAMTGKRAFVYAIAPFITLRCLEQIRVENSIMNIPITIVGVGAGFGYEDSGPTHHMVEDISVMRAMPNVTINSISDNVMAIYFAEASCKMTNTNYIRLDRQPSPDIYRKGHDFSTGVSRIADGKDGCIIATGRIINNAIEAAKKLNKNRGLNLKIIDIYTLPVNDKALLKEIKGVPWIVTLEENWITGGMGSAVLEALNDNAVCMPVKRMGLAFEKGYSYVYGGRNLIHKSYGIDADGIEKAVCEFL